MKGKWVRCPHCRFGRPLQFRMFDGRQHEICPKCHRSFLLEIREGRLEGVYAVPAS